MSKCVRSIVERRSVIFVLVVIIRISNYYYVCDADNEITRVTRFDNLVKLNTIGATLLCRDALYFFYQSILLNGVFLCSSLLRVH